MTDFSDEEKKEIHMFMGRIDTKMEMMETMQKDISSLENDVSNMKSDFSNLKGKLVIVAAVVTGAINAFWSFFKGIF